MLQAKFGSEDVAQRRVASQKLREPDAQGRPGSEKRQRVEAALFEEKHDSKQEAQPRVASGKIWHGESEKRRPREEVG